LSAPSKILREYEETAVVFACHLLFYWLSKTGQLIFFWGGGFCLLLIMEIALRRRSLSVVGFRWPTNRKVLLIFTIALALFFTFGALVHVLFEIEWHYLNQYFWSGVVLGPLVEEIVFRGLIQTRLETALGNTKSWILSSILFSLYHIIAWFIISGKVVTAYTITQLVGVSLVGMFMGISRAKTKSLLPPFLLHAVNNFIAFLT
jgi:membrane protease YdiL (CAAX protease family)